MITSKLTSKAQTTIPQAVRAALRVREGDELVYEIEGDHVILSKRRPAAVDDPFRTFHEWSSAADRRAYAKLRGRPRRRGAVSLLRPSDAATATRTGRFDLWLRARAGLLWVLMITSAENRGWVGDVPVTSLPQAGLPVPSIIRTAKIATIEARDAEPLGKVAVGLRAVVRRHVAATLDVLDRRG